MKIRNVAVFERIQTYLINNFGEVTSLTSMLREVHKSGMDIKRETFTISIGRISKWEILFFR